MSSGLLGFESVHERQAGVTSYISPSRLNCWLRCPLAFRFAYIDGIRQPTTPSLFLGHVVHGAMETLYRHRQLGVILGSEEVTRRMLEGWGQAVDEEGMQFDDVGEEQGLQKQAVDLVAAYIRQMPADEPKPLAVEVAVEAPLIDPWTGEYLGLPLVGVMDLVLDDADGPLVCDFKTSARSGEPLETAHEVQLTSYSLLFRHSQGHDEGGLEIRSLVKTKTPKIETHRYPARSDLHFRRLFAIIREYLDALGAGSLTTDLASRVACVTIASVAERGADRASFVVFQVWTGSLVPRLPVPFAPAAYADDGYITSFSGEKNMRVQKSFDKARAVAHKVVAKLPSSSVEGFYRGRRAGHHAVEDLPRFAGMAAGFVVGAGEAVVDLAVSAIDWAWASEEEGAVETA